MKTLMAEIDDELSEESCKKLFKLRICRRIPKQIMMKNTYIVHSTSPVEHLCTETEGFGGDGCALISLSTMEERERERRRWSCDVRHPIILCGTGARGGGERFEQRRSNVERRVVLLVCTTTTGCCL